MKSLIRLNKWLLMTNFKNSFFEKRIRWQLHSLLNYILYSEFRYSWNLKRILYSNRFGFYLISSLVILVTGSFFCGKMVIKSKVDKLESELIFNKSCIDNLSHVIHNKNKKISDLSIEVKSRQYLEYKIVQESKIEYISNLKMVPDSIFFLMISEADRYNIPHLIFFRVMERESKFLFVKNKEGSSAMGYMQVIKSTFSKYHSKLKLNGGHTPGNNIRVAANLIYSIHEFWKGKFKDERKVWEYSLAEYGCGREPMTTSGGYIIPESVRPGISYVMKYYGK